MESEARKMADVLDRHMPSGYRCRLLIEIWCTQYFAEFQLERVTGDGREWVGTISAAHGKTRGEACRKLIASYPADAVSFMTKRSGCIVNTSKLTVDVMPDVRSFSRNIVIPSASSAEELELAFAVAGK